LTAKEKSEEIILLGQTDVLKISLLLPDINQANDCSRLRAVSLLLKNPCWTNGKAKSAIFERQAANPRAASSVGGRVSEEQKERLPCFHTAFLKPFDSSHQ